MIISELIKKLKIIREERGDMEVVIDKGSLEFQNIEWLRTANYKGEKEFLILTDDEIF